MCTKERALDGPRKQFEAGDSFNSQELVFIVFPDATGSFNASNRDEPDSSCLLLSQADSTGSRAKGLVCRVIHCVMEGVCLGKCMPKGDVERKLNREESEEIHLLREQVRDLSEMNLALRRELQAMQDQGMDANVFSYTSAISVSQKAGRRTLQCFDANFGDEEIPHHTQAGTGPR
eukprot:s638_g6.t1